jgi:hypothetical protein
MAFLLTKCTKHVLASRTHIVRQSFPCANAPDLVAAHGSNRVQDGE